MTINHLMIAEAARRLENKCKEHLTEAYGSDWERFPYFRLELQAFIAILSDIGRGRHFFGKHLIRNGAEGKRLENVGTDLTHNFVLFLIGGPRMLRTPGVLEGVSEYLTTPQADSERAWEHLAIHEMVGCYVKVVRPGIERYYHKIE